MSYPVDTAHHRERCLRCGLPLGPTCVRRRDGRALHHGCESAARWPPEGEVQELWRLCRPAVLSGDREAAGYLHSRGLLGGDLVRVMPAGAPCYSWTRWGGKSWAAAGYRLIVPVYDAGGRLRLLRAWRWRASLATSGPKRIAAKGCQVKGLAMANAAGIRMLRHGDRVADVVIAEGEPDYLTAARVWPGAAVLGIVSGSWCEELALRIAGGSWVAIWTDHDKAGDRYAEQIVESLRGRCRIERGAVGDGDLNKRLLSGTLPAGPFRGCAHGS